MSFESNAQAQLRPGQRLARVCASQGERARVIVEGVELDALVTGALTYRAETAADLPVTGDWVAIREVEPTLALIEHVFPRRSKIARRAAGRRAEEQVLAANVDLAWIFCGLDSDFNVRRLERYLAIVLDGGVTPVIVLNKADLCPDVAAALDEVRRVTRCEQVVAISAHTGAGCDQMEAMLGAGITAVLLGSSGAGKSTLLNRIGALQHRTGPTRDSDGRGRHTTSARELIELPSGASLIDTPGLREIQLWTGADTITAVFDDIAKLAAQCRFSDCRHKNEPGCAVRGAVDAGRLESFHKLHREGSHLPEKQRWRAIHKAAKQFYKIRGR
jgi:ribosome biogenesis GTPase